MFSQADYIYLSHGPNILPGLIMSVFIASLGFLLLYRKTTVLGRYTNLIGKILLISSIVLILNQIYSYSKPRTFNLHGAIEGEFVIKVGTIEQHIHPSLLSLGYFNLAGQKFSYSYFSGINTVKDSLYVGKKVEIVYYPHFYGNDIIWISKSN